ncbi:MAG: PPC domain-containing DNA-binding protein [Pseudomonadota bacterium]
MRGLRTELGYLLRVDKDASLLDALSDFARRHHIESAALVAIGALREVELGYFHVAEKRYDRRRLDGDYELIHLAGNISMLDGAPFVHAHVVLGDENLGCLSGHLFSAVVAVTVEVHLTALPGRVDRRADAGTGINLLDMPEI